MLPEGVLMATLQRVWYAIGRDRKTHQRVEAGAFKSKADAQAYVKSRGIVGAVVYDVKREWWTS